MSDSRSSSPKPQASSPLLWGLFCACSWTWCIGMYLPVIMISRFGWAGFVAFAVPNLLGCSAMGFVLRDRARSRRVVAQHAPMMTMFSLVTVAYQVFFAAWLMELLPWMDAPWWMPMLIALLVYGLGLVFAFTNDRDWLALAIATYAISLSAIAAVGFGALHGHGTGAVPLDRLLWLLPTLFFGFLLCPYLDLTFHRALRHTSAPRTSFVIFGAAFALMLLLTVLLWLNPLVWGRRLAVTLAVGHFMAQLIFTIGAHLREVRLAEGIAIAPTAKRIGLMALPAAGAGVLAITRLVLDRPQTGEWIYLTFLGCYALLLPAYVLIAMASRRPLRSRSEWAMFVVLIAISAPMYARGFLFNETWWLVAPVALAVVWFLTRRFTPGKPGAI